MSTKKTTTRLPRDSRTVVEEDLNFAQGCEEERDLVITVPHRVGLAVSSGVNVSHVVVPIALARTSC
jgi:hypothetical protein